LKDNGRNLVPLEGPPRRINALHVLKEEGKENSIKHYENKSILFELNSMIFEICLLLIEYTFLKEI